MATNYGKLVQQLRTERAALQQQIEKLTQAINALDGTGTSGRGRGRSAGGARKASGATRRRRRTMSAAARRAVSLRMKKYWATRRKAAESK